MTVSTPHFGRFIAALDEADRTRLLASPSEAASAAREVERAVATASAAWPNLELSADVFIARLASHARPGEGCDLASAIQRLHADDLFLASACVQGLPRALAAFDDRYRELARAALRRLRLSPADVDEAEQILRTSLFVAEGGAKPKIADYGGRGDLGAWIRVVAIRTGLRLLRRRRPEGDAVDVARAAVPVGAGDPELAFLKRTYGAELDRALSDAWAALSVRARLLMRSYYGHGLTVDELGALHKVGRSTAARWVTAAREDLVSRTRDLLIERLSIGRADLASILRLVESQVASRIADLVRTPRQP
jgi:RNA polymerase sigma-70 factor (ECF subfamily)